jgi:hypothetical protein
LSAKKKFALSNPNIYKTANSAAAAGPAIGMIRTSPAAVIATQALCGIG